MRVTSQTLPNMLVNQLETLSARQQRLQTQAATGQKIALPEDDPTAVRRVLDLQTEGRSVQQYKENIERLLEYSKAAYAPIKALKQTNDRASEIAVLVDGIDSASDMKLYAKEVNQLIEHSLQLANSKHQGDYLFGGTKVNVPPYEAVRDSEGRITNVVFRGNNETAEMEIAEGLTISAQVAGSNTSGTGPQGLITDARSGADFFRHLISLRDNLESNNKAAVSSTDIPNLQKDEDNFISHFGNIGAVQSRLETTRAVVATRSSTIQALVSQAADADLAETLIRLSETQTAYQAALQSGAQLMSRSLLDYLR